jgi:hypothetical protein
VYAHTPLLHAFVVQALLSLQPAAEVQPQVVVSGYAQTVAPPLSSMLSMRQFLVAPPPVSVMRNWWMLLSAGSPAKVELVSGRSTSIRLDFA